MSEPEQLHLPDVVVVPSPFVDPPGPTGGLPAKNTNIRLTRKLVAGAPGHIRAINKTSTGLSEGSRCVTFTDHRPPEGMLESDFNDLKAALMGGMADAGDEDWPDASTQLNTFCEIRANLTLFDFYPNGPSFVCFFDVFLSGQKLEDYLTVTSRINDMMGELERERAERDAAARQQAEEAERQQAEDLKLGRTAREQGLVEKLRRLEETVAAIRKAGNKLAKKHGVKDWLKDVEA